MALHGEIKINGREIGKWVAVRKTGGTHPDDVNTYEVDVVDFRTDGVHYLLAGHRLTHRYGDGAFALAAKILQTAVYG